MERLPHPVASVVRRLRSEDVFLLAAALAFYALVSLAPFAIVVLWLVSLLAGDDRVRSVADQLALLLPPAVRTGDALQRVADLSTGVGVGAVVALLWPATSYGAGLARAFARLSSREDRPTKGLRARGLTLALMAVMPALTMAGLVASYAGTTLFEGGLLATILAGVVALTFGFLASAAAAAMIYRLFSPGPTRRRGLLMGATTGGASISVLSAAYALFLRVGTDFENRYATSGLAAIVLLALWLFLSNALILVGYQVAQETE